ncbi:MAG: FadR family transcriptional regulator [Halanaerobiales bacterium]|nr:FadR family transcriptional regulator [Halanaerobiales bacterium]
MRFNPIKDKKVYEQIIDQIKEMIYDGKLKKGDKLPSERTLTEELKVSRASIREAFSALEMIGLIESRHGEGTFIKENNDDNFLKPLSLHFMLEENVGKELIEIRKMIEISGARFAAWRATQEDLEELKKWVIMLEENRGNAEMSRMADREFHYALAKATGNELVYKFLNSISEVIDMYLANAMTRIVKNENKNSALIRQHRRIYEAIRSGDEMLAQKAMEDHLVWSEDLLEV